MGIEKFAFRSKSQGPSGPTPPISDGPESAGGSDDDERVHGDHGLLAGAQPDLGDGGGGRAAARGAAPPHQVRNDRAALALLEALALWLDRCPRVVVSAAEADATYSFGLTDEIGNPQRSVYYTVEVVERPIRRRARRIAGVGDFRDLRQLSLSRGGQR